MNMTQNRETPWAIGGAVLARKTPVLGWGGWAGGGEERSWKLFYLTLMQRNPVHHFRSSELPWEFPSWSGSCSSSKYGTKGGVH